MVDVENQPPNTSQPIPGKYIHSFPSSRTLSDQIQLSDDAPIEVKVRANITQLEQLDRSYFGKDRVRKIREILDASTALLDTKPIDLV